MNLPVNDIPRCTSSNAKTLGLKHLHLRDVVSSSGLPDGARIVHHGTDELPVEQDTIPDGEATPPVHERTHHPQSLGEFLTTLIDVRRSGYPSIKNHHQKTVSPNSRTGRGFWMPRALRGVDGDPPFSQPTLHVADAADKQHWLVGRGYDS